MTTAEILLYVRNNISTDFDIADDIGATATDAELVPYINWAMRSISRQIHQLKTSIPITLTADTAEYDLNGGTGTPISASDVSQVTRIHRVYINNNPLKRADWKGPGMFTFNEIERNYPGWRAAGSSTPFAAAQISNKLFLFPKPTSTVVSAGNNYLVAEYLPKDLSTSVLTQIPDLPLELHEAVAYMAAVKLALPNIGEAEAIQRLQLYSAAIADAISEVRKQNLATIADFGSSYGWGIRQRMRV